MPPNKDIEELKAKENEMIEKEASIDVKAYSDLLAELLKRYANEDFAWLEKLALSTETKGESEEKEARGSVSSNDNVQAGGDPPAI
ncbi:hypothetical protein GH714_007783 [Hevea brasiliensis]|uniref:Uncharacterized protein n=1 Tax=Hevea brasiliensis TaxID=3981 RepID=A0A6A6NG71_HEVBR|nr:hypothetical protein GH714_007783 [Hevea brasiliensis]